MALTKKKSLHRLSLFFKFSNNHESPPLPPASPPKPQKNGDGRPRPVSQQLSPRAADGNGWNASHQRAVSAQLQPPPVNYGPATQIPRKAVSSDRLRPTVPNSRPTSVGLKASPSTPNLVPDRSPYLHPSGSTPNLQNLQVSPGNSRPGSRSSTQLLPVFPAALDGPSDSNGKIKRKSGLFGGKKHKKEEEKLPATWICGTSAVPYDIKPLLNGQRVRLLWNDGWYRKETYVM